MTPDRIHVEVPASEARRDRIESHVLERLSAIRSAERADSVVVPDRHRRPWAPWLAGGAAAAAAIAIVFAVVREPPPPSARVSPSIVVTPVGGASRFTVGDAVIDAGSDTSVEVVPGDGGAITLALERGSIDCDVTPRPGRPPFVVVAGEVRIAVVGTRFAVTRLAGTVRVDVTRGKVRVVAPSGTRMLGGGESWSSTAITASLPAKSPREVAPPGAPSSGEPDPSDPDAESNPAEAEIAGTNEDEIVMAPDAVPAQAGSLSPEAAWRAALRLEGTDKAAAARAYRKLASGRGKYAALALYGLAELESGRRRTASALEAAAEYLRRFPDGANAQEVAWLRIEISRNAKQPAAARAAAADYLARFPSGTYATAARRIAGTP